MCALIVLTNLCLLISVLVFFVLLFFLFAFTFQNDIWKAYYMLLLSVGKRSIPHAEMRKIALFFFYLSFRLMKLKRWFISKRCIFYTVVNYSSHIIYQPVIEHGTKSIKFTWFDCVLNTKNSVCDQMCQIILLLKSIKSIGHAWNNFSCY